MSLDGQETQAVLLALGLICGGFVWCLMLTGVADGPVSPIDLIVDHKRLPAWSRFPVKSAVRLLLIYGYIWAAIIGMCVAGAFCFVAIYPLILFFSWVGKL